MLSPDVTARLLGRMRLAAEELTEPPELSERELQALHLIAEGLDNAEIAERLVISPTTAKKHVSHILAKAGVEEPRPSRHLRRAARDCLTYLLRKDGHGKDLPDAQKSMMR
jgi:DNA-binding NarL/FixJ family response regulator